MLPVEANPDELACARSELPAVGVLSSAVLPDPADFSFTTGFLKKKNPPNVKA
jgi:hypothetical protein